ncbi:Vitamin K-dependent gamma-carboxylase [Halomicrobium zhouii]|uniref:Vitamin K-dependent gamma-carboxylase n=1 Tax=Halomicrobium zhouii TaxID=767519 RepID=A0A1I6LCW8_9EURY|nr:HTTM domain-containing protein [Halomicrobium zhouii]SFS01331.1 Vitamin K-dependent gamma-carboxylase [Halomicrobium zhouii]
MTERTTDGSSTLARVRDGLERRFGVDPRSLAALRIALGTLLLLDLALRARDLATFYSDVGVFPRSALAHHYPAMGSLSVHAITGEVWVQGVLFLVAAAFATALLVGYRTRLATLASLVLLVSLHARNPMVLNAGDVLFRRLLFWGLFLPLGARWAVDVDTAATGDAGDDGRDWIATVATAALLVQVVLVYFANVAFKLRTDVWLQGDAIRYVFELDRFTVGLASSVAQYPRLLELAALGWFALLCISPLLLVVTGRARLLLVSLFASGHLGMFLTMDLGIFPLVSLTALLPFLPPSVWDRVEAATEPVRMRLWTGFPSVDPRRVELPVGQRARTARSVFLAGLLASMLLLNAVAVGLVDAPAGTPEAVEDRSWNMFGNPPESESWYVAYATLDSGRNVSGHVSAARWGGPTDGRDRYPRGRWRKFTSNVDRGDEDQLVAALGRDVCRRWSASGDQQVRAVTLERVDEESVLDGPDRRTSTVVWRGDC